DDQRRAFVQLVGDGIVRRGVAGGLDRRRRDGAALRGVAERAYELEVPGRVHELQLPCRRGAGRQQVAVLDQAGRLDQVDRELDPDRLQRVLVGEVMLHQRLAVDEGDRAGHGNL